MATNSSLKKLKSLTFGRGKRQCQTVDKIRCLPDGRIVLLGRCEDDFSADTIYIWKTNSIIPNKIIKERIEPAVDMAVTSSGDVMILRKEDPLIRVLKPDADPTAHAQEIHIEVDQKVKEELLFLETTTEGNIFIVHGDPEAQLIVFNTEGTAIQTVKLGKACGMVYSKVTKTLYVAADDRIAQYHWDGKALSEISSAAKTHGVSRFSCTDVCVGSKGEVFAVGSVDEAVRVYKMVEADGATVMKEVGFEDKETRNSYSPWACVQGDQFALVYGEEKPEIGLFRLI